MGDGLSVLELEHGVQVDIGIDPQSVEDGDPWTVRFRWVGRFGRRIV